MPDYLTTDNRIIRYCLDDCYTSCSLDKNEICTIIGNHSYYVDGNSNIKTIRSKKIIHQNNNKRILAFSEGKISGLNPSEKSYSDGSSSYQTDTRGLVGVLYSNGSLDFIIHSAEGNREKFCQNINLATGGIDYIYEKIELIQHKIKGKNSTEAKEFAIVTISNGHIIIFYVKEDATAFRKVDLNFPKFAVKVHGFHNMVVLDNEGIIWYGSDTEGVFYEHDKTLIPDCISGCITDLQIFGSASALVFLTSVGDVYHLRLDKKSNGSPFTYLPTKYMFSDNIKQIYLCDVFCNALSNNGLLELGCSNNMLEIIKIDRHSIKMLPHQKIYDQI